MFFRSAFTAYLYSASWGKYLIIICVSLVFTGIACATLASQPDFVGILQGTIAAAAVINEIIAVIAAKKGFVLAKEIERV